MKVLSTYPARSMQFINFFICPDNDYSVVLVPLLCISAVLNIYLLRYFCIPFFEKMYTEVSTILGSW